MQTIKGFDKEMNDVLLEEYYRSFFLNQYQKEIQTELLRLKEAGFNQSDILVVVSGFNTLNIEFEFMLNDCVISSLTV